MDTNRTAQSSRSAPAPRAVAIAAHGAPAYLVVLLHGVGADAASFEPVARALAPAVPRADLLVPDGFHPFDGAGSGRQWFSVRGVTEGNRPARVREAGAEVSRFIDAELARRDLAADRVAIVGFSQGAILAGWLAAHRSPPPAAVVMLSGRIADDAPPSRKTSTPVLVAHGTLDPVMPVSLADASARALERWGARVTTRVYPGLAHEVDARELADVAAFLGAALK